MDKTVEAIVKAMGGMGTHFGKSAEHHMALHKCNTAMAKAHTDHAALAKAKHEALENDHVDKAYFGAAHEMHKALAAHHEEAATLHKAHSEHMGACQTAMDGDGKAAKAAAAGAGATADPAAAPAESNAAKLLESADVKATVGGLMGEALTSAVKEIKDSPEFKEMFKKAVMAQVAEQLGDKLVPTSVHGALPDGPKGPTMVPRPGGAPIDSSKVPPEFADALGV